MIEAFFLLQSLESAEGQPLENSEDEDENFDIIQTIEIPSCSVSCIN